MDQINLIEEFSADLKARGLSADTVELYPGYVKTLSKFNHGDLLGVDEDVLGSYIKHLRANKLKQTSINRYFSALNTFYKFLVYKKYIVSNPVTPVKEHFLRQYKTHDTKQRRRYLSIEQTAMLVNSIYDSRDKAIILLMLKTGIRRKELSELDAKDIDMGNRTIRLKPTAKRSNEIVYFDDETAYVLKRWLKRRDNINENGDPALFLDRFGRRLQTNPINVLFTKHAKAVGLHDPESDRLQDRFSPHCCRHWFTSRLVEAGCPRQYVKELRGDAGHDAIDVYTHIDKKKLQQAYEDCIPKLGII